MSFSFDPQQLVYADPFQKIYHLSVTTGGFTKEYFVRDTGSRAGVLVVRNAAVLLVRQYRLLINGFSWEIPGGRIEEGETPAQAAMRECLEEAGVRCHTLRPLLQFQPGLDILHNPTYLFYAEDGVESARVSSDPREVQRREWVALPRCLEMVIANTIVDSLSVTALLAYHVLVAKHEGMPMR